MRTAALILAFGISFVGVVSAATHSSPSGVFSFEASKDWSQLKGQSFFSLDGPGSVSLSDMPLPEAASSEPLETVDEKASYFHSMTFPIQLISGPEKVVGPGWEGLLRRQTNGLGQYELQLVVKSPAGALLFYATAPAEATEAQKQELEKVLLSLRLKQAGTKANNSSKPTPLRGAA